MDNNIVRFGRKSELFFELSPFYYRVFTIGGYKWRTLIHYWYASYFNDMDIKEMIRDMDTPECVIANCKKMGVNDLNIVDSKYIISGIVSRFSQNKDIKDILLMTRGFILEYDGFGYLKENNRYGKLLMKLREKYSNEAK